MAPPPRKRFVTRHGGSRKVPAEEWRGRLANARAYRKAAHDLLELAEEGNGNPIMSNAIHASIAYADAITIRVGGIQNAKAHRDIVQNLRRVLGDRADGPQLTRLARIVGRKDPVQYGHRPATIEEARQLVEQSDRFAEWAEAVIAAS